MFDVLLCHTKGFVRKPAYLNLVIINNSMVGLLPEKYQKYWIKGAIFFIIILVLVSFFQESGEMVNYKNELNTEYRGIVLNKYIDVSDHSICKLKLKSGEIVSVWDNCYEKVAIKDSVVKKKGSFDLAIYKSSGSVIIVNIEDNLIIPNK